MPEAQSVALGIFVDVGSRDESESQAGIAHALEHMFGTYVI
jgi:predicted Zn-dependent peptidase